MVGFKLIHVAVISKLISHLPDCQGPVEEDDIRVCSKVADLIFSLFDGLMALTTSYSYVMRLQCMLPSREKLLRLFAIIPSLYPFTNIPRILTKSIGIVDGKDEITATEVSKKIFFIASIALALNQTAMHVLLIHQLLSTKSMIHSRLSKFTIEKLVLIACMIVNFACIIGASFYLYAQQFAAVALLYLFLAFDFLIFCKVNQLIARAMKEPVGGEMATSFVPQDLTEAKEVNDISQV